MVEIGLDLGGLETFVEVIIWQRSAQKGLGNELQGRKSSEYVAIIF